MKIESAKFFRGVKGSDKALEDGIPQFAFIGRSNAGKSSVINCLTKNKGLARTSSFPGFTRQINLFLINDSLYFVDLPGYGYAKISASERQKIQEMVKWYFFRSGIVQRKIFLIIDADVGLTKDDLSVLRTFEEVEKNVVIIANKIDKIRKSDYEEKIATINELSWPHKVILFSAKDKIGIEDFLNELN
ncbi:ribosome biogenesis GTP-binding protein YihA/YsxC [bacterium]|nr:ribosome biogenesis GTP-binding protein YihA/YsxC [bacterium]